MLFADRWRLPIANQCAQHAVRQSFSTSMPVMSAVALAAAIGSECFDTHARGQCPAIDGKSDASVLVAALKLNFLLRETAAEGS